MKTKPRVARPVAVAQASTPLLERKASSLSGASGLIAGLRGGEEEAGVEHGGAGDPERHADLAEAGQGGAAGADLQRRHVVEEAERQRDREEEDRRSAP